MFVNGRLVPCGAPQQAPEFMLHIETSGLDVFLWKWNLREMLIYSTSRLNTPFLRKFAVC